VAGGLTAVSAGPLGVWTVIRRASAFLNARGSHLRSLQVELTVPTADSDWIPRIWHFLSVHILSPVR
jgi:hypothetical protein